MSSDNLNLPPAINLTTNGASGVATFVNGTLNVPNYTASSSSAIWGQITGTLTNQSDLVTALNARLAKGTRTIFCIDNGDFTSLQAAINTVPTATPTTILVGEKSGGWGNITIPANTVLQIVGLSAPRSDQHVQIGSVTFSPTTGSIALQNEVFLSNLYIVPPASTASITYGGTAISRLRVFNCFIYGNTVTSIALSNSNSGSSFYLYDTFVDSSTAITHVQTSLAYSDFERCYFNVGRSFNCTAGSTLIGSSTLNNASATLETVTVSGTGTLATIGNCLITNTTTNGNGVNIGTGAVFSSVNNIFQVATGTGYCVTGTGTHGYGLVTSLNSAALAYNVKMKNTLTNIPYTTSLTSSP
jgi:hypothetical protein